MRFGDINIYSKINLSFKFNYIKFLFFHISEKLIFISIVIYLLDILNYFTIKSMTERKYKIIKKI